MRFKFEAVDLFSGCGGLSCGLTQAGFKIKAAVEIEESVAKTYSAYPPLAKVNVLSGNEKGDICKLSGERILSAAGIDRNDIYLFAGCPPCQNFSRKNPNNKKKSVDTRKKLLFEFLRVIEEITPPFILMENVSGIRTAYNLPILNEFLARLGKKYYVVSDILNAADYGVPQLRRRFVLHAVRNDIKKTLDRLGYDFTLPEATHSRDGVDGLAPWKTVKDAIGDLPAIKAGETYTGDDKIHNHKCAGLDEDNLKRIQIIRKHGGSRSCLPEELVLPCHKRLKADGAVNGHGDVYGIMDADQPSPTMTGGCLFYTKGRYGHYAQDRAISIREAARLQTFPDDYIFSNSLTSSALQIGNAVPIDLVKASGNVLHRAMYLVKETRSHNRNGAKHA